MAKSDEILQTFGQVLREKRKGAELSQEQLALQSGLDRTYISLLERGLRQPTLSTLFTIAESLRIKPSNLIRLLEDSIADKHKRFLT